MLTVSELPRNPVILTLLEGGHTIVAERRKGARLRVRCSCPGHGREGWCPHLVEVLCLRTGALRGAEPDWEFHLEELVLGTPLEDLAHEVDHALADYAAARRALAACPADPSERGALALTAACAADLASAARALEDVLQRFRKRLAAGDA